MHVPQDGASPEPTLNDDIGEALRLQMYRTQVAIRERSSRKSGESTT